MRKRLLIGILVFVVVAIVSTAFYYWSTVGRNFPDIQAVAKNLENGSYETASGLTIAAESLGGNRTEAVWSPATTGEGFLVPAKGCLILQHEADILNYVEWRFQNISDQDIVIRFPSISRGRALIRANGDCLAFGYNTYPWLDVRARATFTINPNLSIDVFGSWLFHNLDGIALATLAGMLFAFAITVLLGMIVIVIIELTEKPASP